MRRTVTPSQLIDFCRIGLRAVGIALVGTLGLAAPALASDGILELNQTCATQTGCFAGDAAGFPITISESGSYAFTSNLTLTDPNTIGVEVTTAFVSIDLRGFTLSGPITCTGFGFNQGLVCGAGTGDGISTGTQAGIAVRGGTIRGFGDQGLIANGSEAQIENMTFHENGRLAASVGDGARIRNVLAERNGGNGTSPALQASTGALVENVVVRQNQNNGMVVGSYSIVRGNTASNNGLNGMNSGFTCTVVHNAAAGNGVDGIVAGKNSQVSDNTSGQNGGDGIQTTTDSNVQRNSLAENDGYGLRFTGANGAYRENLISNNTTGTILGGLNMGSNSCNGVAICP